MKNGVRYTELDMGELGEQNVCVIFDNGQIVNVYWDSLDILKELSKTKLEKIIQSLVVDDKYTDFLIKQAKGE